MGVFNVGSLSYIPNFDISQDSAKNAIVFYKLMPFSIFPINDSVAR